MDNCSKCGVLTCPDSYFEQLVQHGIQSRVNRPKMPTPPSFFTLSPLLETPLSSSTGPKRGEAVPSGALWNAHPYQLDEGPSCDGERQRDMDDW